MEFTDDTTVLAIVMMVPCDKHNMTRAYACWEQRHDQSRQFSFGVCPERVTSYFKAKFHAGSR